MPTRRVFSLLAASALLCAFAAYGQDSQSLGDVARQTRQQKQQKDAPAKDATSKDASSKPASGTNASAKAAQPKSPHVITNDEIPSHLTPTKTAAGGPQTADQPDTVLSSSDRDARAEQLKSQIQSQKNAIASLESEIADLSESVRYAGGNCVANCVQWNERQKEKQDQVESMKTQLEEQKKQLESVQDSARKQGFGSSVYE